MKLNFSSFIVLILLFQSCTKEKIFSDVSVDELKKVTQKDNILVPTEYYENGVLKRKFFYENGRVSKVIHYTGVIGTEVIYEYDLKNYKQISYRNNIPSILDYAFDKQGNITSFGSLNTIGLTSYSYKNNLLIELATNSQSSAGTTSSNTKYTYNSKNQILSSLQRGINKDINAIITYEDETSTIFKWENNSRYLSESTLKVIESGITTSLKTNTSESFYPKINNPTFFLIFSPFDTEKIVENRIQLREKGGKAFGPQATYVNPLEEFIEKSSEFEGNITTVITKNYNIKLNKYNFPTSYTSEKIIKNNNVISSVDIKNIEYKYQQLYNKNSTL